MLRRFLLVSLALSALSCGSPPRVGGDAGNPADAGHPPELVDAGGSVDAGDVLDAGELLDAGPLDGGLEDAGSIDGGSPDAGALDAGALDAGSIDGGAEDAGAPDAGLQRPDAGPWDGIPFRVRVMAANTTSGNYQSYDPGPGTRIFEGLKPDVALVQEFNYGDGSDATLRGYIDATFGPEFSYFRESGAQIPNGVVSRWPIVAAGNWTDPEVSNRSFVWAQIDLPGPRDLWAFSLHLLTRSATVRDSEARALVTDIQAYIPEGDLLVLGGDFNTNTGGEGCISTLSAVVEVDTARPTDQAGTDGTNASRSKPYDWVLADPDLNPLEVPVALGSNSFPHGLVFDSRVYTPLTDVTPVLATDSDAPSMQHMAVVRDFEISD